MQTYLFPWRIEEVEENTKIKRNCVCVCFEGGLASFLFFDFSMYRWITLSAVIASSFCCGCCLAAIVRNKGRIDPFFFFYQKLSTGIAKVLFFFFVVVSYPPFFGTSVFRPNPLFFFYPFFFFLYFLSRCLIFWIVFFFFFSQLPVCCSLFVLLLCLYSFHHLAELSLLVFSVTVMWYLVTSALSLSVLVLIYDSNKEGKEERHQKKCPTVFFFLGGKPVLDELLTVPSYREKRWTLHCVIDIYIYM